MYSWCNIHVYLFSSSFFLILEEIGFKKKQILFESWFSDA